jgi:retinol dehydrogenase 12
MDQTLQGKTYVITGATSGIGFATTGILASQGANVIGIGRSFESCQIADGKLKALHPLRKIAWCAIDLSTLANVHLLPGEIQNHLQGWNVSGLEGLLNNAATVPFHQTFTEEGLDSQWAVNHMAPFILSLKLLPFLQKGKSARIVTVSSRSHYRGRIHWEDIQLLRHYFILKAYEQTKLCNVLFTAELDRRLSGSGMRAFAADPGLVKTNIGRKSKSFLAKWAWSIHSRRGIPAYESAAGIVYLLTDPSIQEAHDIYWKHGKPKPPNPIALDVDSARRLWDISVEFSGMPASEVNQLFQWE